MKSVLKLDKNILDRIRVRPGASVKLRTFSTSWAADRRLQKNEVDLERIEAKKRIQKNVAKLSDAQELLYASGSHGILIVLQGMDASGKDGTIKHVMSGVNPQGCQVYSFKQPTQEELQHHFLWRYIKATPSRGQISLFNRSHYEDVVTVRVHPQWLEKQGIASEKLHSKFWRERYQTINLFEKSLSVNNISILKFFLHISKNEQKQRLIERLNQKSKYWKFSESDLAEREYWSQYQKYYSEAISATSTEWAPWYVIPADSKWTARALIADIISVHIHSLKLKHKSYPPNIEDLVAEFRRRLETD